MKVYSGTSGRATADSKSMAAFTRGARRVYGRLLRRKTRRDADRSILREVLA